MPQPLKQTPEKYCSYCGKRMERKRYGNRWEDMSRFLKREYCSLKCVGMARRKENPTKSAIGKRLKKHRESKCVICGSTSGLATHHMNGDRYNNVSENLMTLCGSCHTKWHWENGKKMPKRQSDCKICGAPARKLDMCQKHYQRYKKYGSPYLHKKKVGSSFVLWDDRGGLRG